MLERGEVNRDGSSLNLTKRQSVQCRLSATNRFLRNGPFAEYNHMVRKTPCWMTNDAEGQETQRDDLSFHGPTASFAIQQGVFFVPSFRILQRAHSIPFQAFLVLNV